MIIRDAVRDDLPSIQSIINYYRMNTSHLWERRPLTMEEMEEWLRGHSQPPYAAIVLEESGMVIGYASLSQFRPYEGFSPTTENSIYLDPSRTGKGYGSILMEALLKRAKSNGFKVITAWIDSRNTESVRFHERFGFYHVGIMKNAGILDGKPGSAVIMQYDVD
ncbi:MAG: GNAT family N-acetyltransferase [Armatimonadota bacterium]